MDPIANIKFKVNSLPWAMYKDPCKGTRKILNPKVMFFRLDHCNARKSEAQTKYRFCLAKTPKETSINSLLRTT